MAFLKTKFARVPEILQANLVAFQAGWSFGETTEDFAVSYEIKPAQLPAGRYRNISGNLALSYGLVAASQLTGLPLFLGSYPITPASDILHELSKHKRFGVRTFQAEDEIAAVGAALGASYGGSLAVTSTSGPGLALKAETIGLGVSLELPLIVVDVQRAGPSTGMPTKTEQADLLQAMFGRNGEAPVPIVAPRSPADCFDTAIEAARIATTYRVPVILLSDGYLANGSEPWKIPDVEDLPDLRVTFATETNAEEDGRAVFHPYLRDPETLARPWAVPGTAGLEHRIGGIEKADGTGNISYDPANHDFMVRTRQAKVDAVAATIPPLEVEDPSGHARVLVLGWGSTYGPIGAACRLVRAAGARGRPDPPAPPQPVPERPRRRPAPLRAGPHPGDEPRLRVRRPARDAGAGQVPRRRDRLPPGARAAVQGRGARRGHHHLHRRHRNRGHRMTEYRSLDLVPKAREPQSAKEFKTDQEVRWCPGCGDYAILAAVQSFMPELGLARENIVFVSGIGCSSRFPYYMDTFGMHSIHGRAPAIATGLAASRPDLSVWVVTGDGDALSIGGNHLIHALRRNVNLKILLFNNRIYGLTKGQYSPTSELGKITKSTPLGSLDSPFNPVSLALGAEASFVARSIDSDRKHLTSVLRAAAAHQGTALVEIYQNCNIFNDNAFETLKDPATRDDFTIRLEHGQPIVWGVDGEHARRARPRHVAQGGGDRVGRRRRDRGARRARRGPVARVRPVPAGRGLARPHPDRRLPRRRPPGLRRAHARPAGPGRRDPGRRRPRRPHRPARRLRHLDHRLTAAACPPNDHGSVIVGGQPR